MTIEKNILENIKGALEKLTNYNKDLAMHIGVKNYFIGKIGNKVLFDLKAKQEYNPKKFYKKIDDLLKYFSDDNENKVEKN